jgi:hypothetical protein
MNKNSITINLNSSENQIAICGGAYNNFASVEKFLNETKNIQYRFCLGDLGGFGPYPDRTIDLLRSAGVICLQGNYDYSVGFEEIDCGCGYIDPRDRHFAQLSFDYTFKKTSLRNRLWLQSLPSEIIVHWNNQKLLFCHGSPDSTNEFVWASELDLIKVSNWFSDYQVQMICCTHSGIPWIKELDQSKKWFNVGVLGRPAHENSSRVFYGVVEIKDNNLIPSLIPMEYDFQTLIDEMKKENLPQEFCESISTGIWTTCSNILPAEEMKIKNRV